MPRLVFKRADNIINTPCWKLLPVALAEIHALGYSSDTNHMPGFDEAVFYAENEVGPVGFLTYKEWTVGIWAIGTSWVAPEFRRAGIHTTLFNNLVERAKAKGIMKITTGTHVKNTRAREAFHKQGREPTYIHYEYRVFEALDDATLEAAGVKPK